MTPERMAERVIRWVRLYTRDVPPPLAERRAEEVRADLHDHIAHERARGTGDRRIALHVLSRMLRGLAADVAWRQRVRHDKGELMRSFVILAVALAVAAIGIVAILYGQEDDAPGLVLIGILLIVGAFAGGVRTAQRSR